MIWPDIIQRLNSGQTVQFRPKGGSMKGRIESGQLITVEPVDKSKLEIGDAVVCKVRGTYYVHLVKGMVNGEFLIGNNRGGTNGWTSQIYGKVIKVES